MNLQSKYCDIHEAPVDQNGVKCGLEIPITILIYIERERFILMRLSLDFLNKTSKSVSLQQVAFLVPKLDSSINLV